MTAGNADADADTDDEADDGHNAARLRPERLEDVSRRQFLAGAGGVVGAVGAGKALNNTVLGYGELGYGTNLHEQDLRPVVTERLGASYDESLGDVRVRVDGDALVVEADDAYRLPFDPEGRAEAAELDAELGAEGQLAAAHADVGAVAAESFVLEFSEPAAFFERAAAAETRPEAVVALRGRWDRLADPEVIGEFAGVPPAETAALVEGLMEGFREHGTYDVPRYVAGSIEDNVILGAADLRRYFAADVDFESLLEAEETGLFCWELVWRSLEAFHAVSPREQTVPVAACYVQDSRHKHAYTGLVTAIRDDETLRVPMTFVDYTYTTLYDDFRLTGIKGDGLAAYDTGHRATDIIW